jgi:hypothetical protein
MTDEEEFAARSQLKWTREGDAWILLYRRRRMGRVVADKDYPEMWRSTKPDGTLSDLANLSWSKDGVLAQAAREIAHERANTPSKPQENRVSFQRKSSPMRTIHHALQGLRSHATPARIHLTIPQAIRAPPPPNGSGRSE